MEAKLQQALNNLYQDAFNKLNEFKAQLPDNLKGFIDAQMKNLEHARTELAKDINFYVINDKPDDIKLKNFKIHCADRFLAIVLLSEPERIKSYGITYDEYINPRKSR
ncbi:MAG: hypothetical protein IKM94_00105 [Alphaproteobacteria bacterium]|nr:hypothetical protein [Alphaproteobacteria bacterium]